ncbi:AtpZ/AtpI family protein [Peptococcus simiae]|uniref:AtpZ/AtpI family protein n=1 Tax=Peptococcus simiae TaxID=1643805 RepID=A0ABW9H092_9FIRM
MTNGNWRPKPPRRPGSDSVWFRAFNVALSFGVTLGASLFIMWHLGQWIDGKIGTYFVFTALGIIIAVISGFRILIRELTHFEEGLASGRRPDDPAKKGETK